LILRRQAVSNQPVRRLTGYLISNEAAMTYYVLPFVVRL
jgi:hypothetical protein